MENENIQELETAEAQAEETAGGPRPVWQRVAAWVALALFVAVIAMYYINIMRGGR